MSDLLTPVAVRHLPRLHEDTQANILVVLEAICVELRVLNAVTADGLNSREDLDALRQDSYNGDTQ